MPASEISYTSLMFESSFDSPGSLSRFSSKIPTQAIPRAARPAAMPFASPTSKQMPSLKDHRILHPPRSGCKLLRDDAVFGWIGWGDDPLVQVPVNHQEVVQKRCPPKIGKLTNPPSKMTEIVGKIWILLSRAPNFRDVPTKPLRTTVTSCMEEGIASSKSCCWGGGYVNSHISSQESIQQKSY